MSTEEVADSDGEEEGYKVDTNWNICQYLPETCQEVFKVVIGGYLHSLYQHILMKQREYDPGCTPIEPHSQVASSIEGNTYMYMYYRRHPVME